MVKKIIVVLIVLLGVHSEASAQLNADSLNFYSEEFTLTSFEDSLSFGAGEYEEYFIEVPTTSLYTASYVIIELKQMDSNTIVYQQRFAKADFINNNQVVNGQAKVSLGKYFISSYTVNVVLERDDKKYDRKVTKSIII